MVRRAEFRELMMAQGQGNNNINGGGEEFKRHDNCYFGGSLGLECKKRSTSTSSALKKDRIIECTPKKEWVSKEVQTSKCQTPSLANSLKVREGLNGILTNSKEKSAKKQRKAVIYSDQKTLAKGNL